MGDRSIMSCCDTQSPQDGQQMPSFAPRQKFAPHQTCAGARVSTHGHCPDTAVMRKRTHVLRMPEDFPNLSVSSLICTASSRVGASTSMVGPIRGSFLVALMCSMPAKRNQVFRCHLRNYLLA